MNFEDELRIIAKRKIRDGFSFIDKDVHPMPADIRDRVEELLKLIKRDLSENDIQKYRGYIPIFAPDRNALTKDIENNALAMAKLCFLSERAESRILAERHISEKFEDSRLFELFPELEKNIDKDGLLPISCFEKILPDAVQYKNYALYLSVPYRLTRQLLSLVEKNPSQQLRLRINHYKICPIANYFERLEEEFVRGPSFKKDALLKRLYVPNTMTVLQRNPKTELETQYLKLMAPVERFEANRNERDSRISISAEELVPITNEHLDVGYVNTKLFHSDLDLKEGSEILKHADYTQLVYTFDRYIKRLESTIVDKIDAEGHYKLFWIGNISLETWVALFSQTFLKNELAVEYLTGKAWQVP